jgi:hypothetical protein
MATRRNLDSSEPAPVKPPLGAELWPSRPLEELAMEPAPPPVERIDDLFGQGADRWSEDSDDERFLAWLEAMRRAEG